MKVSGSISWADISSNIANEIKNNALRKKQASKEHVVIVSEEDTKNEAKQSAIAYWTMGWSWDEIEAVLEDAEYPKAAITYAMKEAKSYAKEILNNGPFTTVRTGHLVCLKNGYVCEFEGADSSGVHVRVIGSMNKEGHDPSFELTISAEDLDKDASKRLAKAYELEKKAGLMLAELEKPYANKTAGISRDFQKSSLDDIINKKMRVVEDSVVAALDAVTGAVPSTSTKAAALTRDTDRLLQVASLVDRISKDLWYLHDADLEDNGTPEECMNMINASVNALANYVMEHVASVPDEYARSSENVLNATSAQRYDSWDESIYAGLITAANTLSELVADHKEYVQVRSTQRLLDSNSGRK